MKRGLVMEGGAMRGIYTAGVTDVFMENGISFDGAAGVSAGAVFGCNYKSSQPGRVIRYNKKYCRDWRYASFRSLLTTGDLYGVQFCYDDIPKRLDPFDTKAFRESTMSFYVVCTDVVTGAPVYHCCDHGDEKDIQWLRASASMPLFSKIVEIDGKFLSDGGTADSIPIRYLQSLGYNRNVVILTQPEGFVKKKNRLLFVARIFLRKYPALVNALENRHFRYNETLDYIHEQERLGRILVFRPRQALAVGAMERDPEKLEQVYRLGREDAGRRIDEVKSFLRDE